MSEPKHPARQGGSDLNRLAHRIVQETTSEQTAKGKPPRPNKPKRKPPKPR